MTSKNSQEWLKMIYRELFIIGRFNSLIRFLRSRAAASIGSQPLNQNKSNGIKSSEMEETDSSEAAQEEENSTTTENSDLQNQPNQTELDAMEKETEQKLEEDNNDINENANPGIIKAKLIRTEGPLAELPIGTFFFTLYADDFIESSMKALLKGINDEKQEKIYRIVNERFHMLTVSLISKQFFII